jgi:hypothetical protein
MKSFEIKHVRISGTFSLSALVDVVLDIVECFTFSEAKVILIKVVDESKLFRLFFIAQSN